MLKTVVLFCAACVAFTFSGAAVRAEPPIEACKTKIMLYSWSLDPRLTYVSFDKPKSIEQGPAFIVEWSVAIKTSTENRRGYVSCVGDSDKREIYKISFRNELADTPSSVILPDGPLERGY